jgi:uncharacterized protein YkwD
MKTIIATVFSFILSISYSQFSNDDLDKMIISKNKKSYNKINFDSLSNATILLINKYRLENNLNSLEIDTSLNNYSKNWGKHLCENNQLVHSETEKLNIVSENIYGLFTFGFFICDVGYFKSQPKIVFDSWRTSIEHNKNMLNDKAKKIGLYIYTEYEDKYKMRAVMVMK